MQNCKFLHVPCLLARVEGGKQLGQGPVDVSKIRLENHQTLMPSSDEIGHAMCRTRNQTPLVIALLFWSHFQIPCTRTSWIAWAGLLD